MVRLYRCLGEPFASLTCSKFIEMFSKHDFMITRKNRRTISINSRTKKFCSTKVLTQPPYQINCPTTLYMVEREVGVYGYVYNPTGITAVESVSLLFEKRMSHYSAYACTWDIRNFFFRPKSELCLYCSRE